MEFFLLLGIVVIFHGCCDIYDCRKGGFSNHKWKFIFKLGLGIFSIIVGLVNIIAAIDLWDGKL